MLRTLKTSRIKIWLLCFVAGCGSFIILVSLFGQLQSMREAMTVNDGIQLQQNEFTNTKPVKGAMKMNRGISLQQTELTGTETVKGAMKMNRGISLQQTELTGSETVKGAMEEDDDKKLQQNKFSDKETLDHSSKSKDQENMTESRFQTRNEYLRQKCEALTPTIGNNTCPLSKVAGNTIVVNGSDISVCLVKKSGSTFWQRIFRVFGGKGDDVFSIKAGIAYNKGGAYMELKEQNMSKSDMIKTAKQLTSVLYVRDPYSRTFSGWYDKLYSPNTPYWQALGRKIIQSERPWATDSSLQCGCDVTFPEFISYLARKLSEDSCNFDGHFSSSYNQCLPCDMSYNYIGKYETIKEDTKYLLQHLNFSRKIALPEENSGFSFREFLDSSDFVFGAKKKIVESVSFRCALSRLWRRFQGRGLIDARISLPVVSDEHADNLTVNEFNQILIKACNDSNHDTLKLNRQESLSQAYSYVNKDLLQKFQTVFNLDFELFGYSKTAPIAEKSPTINFLEQCAQRDYSAKRRET